MSHRDYHHGHTSSISGNKFERVTSIFAATTKKPESPTTKKTQKIAQTLRGLVSTAAPPVVTEDKLEKNPSGNLTSESKGTCHALLDQIRTNLIKLTDTAPKKASPAQAEGHDSGSDRRHAEVRDSRDNAAPLRAEKKPLAATITLSSGINLFPKGLTTTKVAAPHKNSPGSTATSTSTYCMLSPRNTFVNNRIGAGTKASLPKFRSRGPSITGMGAVMGGNTGNTTGTGTGTTTTTNSTATKIKDTEPSAPLYVFSPNIEGRIMSFLQTSKIELTSSPYNGHAIKKKEAPTLTLVPRKKFMRV